jgi:hypothetical protein
VYEKCTKNSPVSRQASTGELQGLPTPAREAIHAAFRKAVFQILTLRVVRRVRTPTVQPRTKSTSPTDAPQEERCLGCTIEILNAFEYLKLCLRHPTTPTVSSKHPSSPNDASCDKSLVAEMCDEFLEWSQKHNAPRTYEWYRNHIQSFVSFERDGQKFGTLAIDAFKPIHVEWWVDAHPTGGTSHQRGAKTASPAGIQVGRAHGCRTHKPDPLPSKTTDW